MYTCIHTFIIYLPVLYCTGMYMYLISLNKAWKFTVQCKIFDGYINFADLPKNLFCFVC